MLNEILFKNVLEIFQRSHGFAEAESLLQKFYQTHGFQHLKISWQSYVDYPSI